MTCWTEVLYTPPPGGEPTTDSFVFYANDSHQNSEPATVNVTVRGPCGWTPPG